jgi:plastocyanin
MSFVDSISGNFVSTIPVGTTLEWDWVSSPHSSTSGTCSATNCVPDGLWDSGQHNSGFVYTRQFNSVGTFNYYCTVHTVNMVGVVNVIPTTPSVPGRRR